MQFLENKKIIYFNKNLVEKQYIIIYTFIKNVNLFKKKIIIMNYIFKII